MDLLLLLKIIAERCEKRVTDCNVHITNTAV